MEVTTDPDVRAIEQLITKWIAASRAGEHGRVLELMSRDAVFLVPGRVAFRGRDEFAAGLGAMQDWLVEGASEIEEVRVFGEWAYAWTRLTVQMTPRAGGETVIRQGPTLSVLHKEAGRWLIHRDANLLARVAEQMSE